jgi:hypothetical protein
MWLDLVFEIVDLVVHSGSWRYTLACQMCLHRGLFRRASLGIIIWRVCGGGLRPQCHMGGAVALLSARSALSVLQRAAQCLWGAGQGGRGRPRRWPAGRVVRPAAQFFALNWV